jgi:monovalent cation:H+ antiporter-2, CPA2 family
MQQTDPFVALAVLLAAALVGGMIAHRMRQPVILGYLAVGVIVGPHVLGLVGDLAIVETAATIGVTLLMFTLGMEVSISQLREVGKIGVWGGILQMVGAIGLGILAGYALFGWPLTQAILFGLIISLSSTAVCLKILMDRGELASVQGRIMLALLIMQDISVIFMMLALPLMAGATDNVAVMLLTSVGKVLIFIVVTFLLGRWVLPWLLGGAGGFRSRELFLLTVLVLCLGAAVSTQIFGLSIVFGAFLVGLVLRQTKFVHQALAETMPLRDIFASLFFVSLGMLLDPQFLIDNLVAVLLTIAVIFAIKTLVIFGIVRVFGYSFRVALLTGVGLFQLGEFGFILAQGGFEIGIVSEYFYSLILASAIITMILTPLASGIASKLYHGVASRRPPKGTAVRRHVHESVEAPPTTAPRRIVIAGFGEVGHSIADGLLEAGIPHFIIDGDPNRVSEAKSGGHPRIFGDATNIHVLEQANLKRAKALVVSYPDPSAVITTIKAARQINPEIIILARANRKTDAAELEKLGVKLLVIPEREAGYAFVKKLLKVSGLKTGERGSVLATLREKRKTPRK